MLPSAMLDTNHITLEYSMKMYKSAPIACFLLFQHLLYVIISCKLNKCGKNETTLFYVFTDFGSSSKVSIIIVDNQGG